MNKSKERATLLEEMLAIGKSFSQTGGSQDWLPAETRGFELSGEDDIPTAPLSELYGPLNCPALVDMMTNRAYPVKQASSVIGCGSACDIVIEDTPENHTISRNHCIITLENGRVYLEDISTNGTSIGDLGQPDDSFYALPESLRVELRPFQVVSFAGRRFILTNI